MLTTIITHIALIALVTFIFVNVVNLMSSKLYERKRKKIEKFYNSLTDEEKFDCSRPGICLLGRMLELYQRVLHTRK